MNIAHDLQLSDEQLNMATAIAAPFFAGPIADSLRSPKAPGVMDFCTFAASSEKRPCLACGATGKS